MNTGVYGLLFCLWLGTFGKSKAYNKFWLYFDISLSVTYQLVMAWLPFTLQIITNAITGTSSVWGGDDTFNETVRYLVGVGFNAAGATGLLATGALWPLVRKYLLFVKDYSVEEVINEEKNEETNEDANASVLDGGVFDDF